MRTVTMSVAHDWPTVASARWEEPVGFCVHPGGGAYAASTIPLSTCQAKKQSPQRLLAVGSYLTVTFSTQS